MLHDKREEKQQTFQRRPSFYFYIHIFWFFFSDGEWISWPILTSIFVVFGICKREHSGLPPRKNTTAPRRIMKMLTAVSVKEKQGAGLSYSNHNLWRHDAPSHLTFERNDEIRTGYAPETESRTWSSRLYCDGGFHHYICRFVFHYCLMVCSKLAKKYEAAKDSRSHFVHTFQAPFTSRSHFAHKTHLPLYQSWD